MQTSSASRIASEASWSSPPGSLDDASDAPNAFNGFLTDDDAFESSPTDERVTSRKTSSTVSSAEASNRPASTNRRNSAGISCRFESSSPIAVAKSFVTVHARRTAAAAAASAATLLACLGLARCGGNDANFKPASPAFLAALARPTARSRSGAPRKPRVAVSTASAMTEPLSAAHQTASCLSRIAPTSRSGAAIHRRIVRRPASVEHPNEIRLRSDPSAVPSAPRMSSRLVIVHASMRTRPCAYTSCGFVDASNPAMIGEQFNRERCATTAAAHARATGRAPATVALDAHLHDDEPDARPRARSADAAPTGNSSPAVSAVTRGLAAHLTSSRRATSLTRPLRTSTSAGDTCASSVASAVPCSSSGGRTPRWIVPAAASRNEYPTAALDPALLNASSFFVPTSSSCSPFSSPPASRISSSSSSANAMMCVASGAATASSPTSPSVLVAGVETSASARRITAFEPPRAFACAAVSSCSMRPTLCPRCTSLAHAASTPASGHPTCLQCPTPDTVIFQSSSRQPISASSSYSS